MENKEQDLIIHKQDQKNTGNSAFDMPLPSASTSDQKAQTNSFTEDFSTRQSVTVHQHSDTVERATDGTRNLVQNFGDMAVQSIKSVQEENEDAQWGKRKLEHVADIIDANATAGIANDYVRFLNREANRYIAADIFFDNNGSVPSEVSKYYDTHGFTMGISKTYEAVSKNPEKFYKGDGTLNFDQDKVMKYIKNHEKYADSDVNHENPLKYENKKARKQEAQMKSYVRINQLEADMRSHLELFTNEERELLKPENNNLMFEFKNIKDISRAERMVDKIVMQDVKDLKILGIDFESQALLKGQFSMEKLSRMTAKETRYLIKDLNKMLLDTTLSDEKVKAIQGLINKLNSKVLLSDSMEKISKLNLRSGAKSLLMLAGGDEIFNSDIGQGFGYVNRFYRFSRTATVAGVHAAKLAGRATHKVAKTVAPEITDVIDKEIEKVITAPKNAAKAVGEHARNSKVGKLLGEKHKSFSELHKRMRDKIANSKVGKALKFGDQARKKVTGVVSAPFKFISKITDFVKKQILIPIVLGCGGLFLLFVLFGMIGGGGGSAASIIILSDENQFKDYQAKYDSCDEQFQAQVSSIINGNAQTSNLRGQAIPYGINVPGITTNGLNVPAEYKNGVTLNYFYDGTQIAGISSNIEDCLSAMTVIMQQNQSAHHAEALELLEAIYKSTHSYTTSESALYPCTAGCVDELYYCNQHKGQTAEDGTAGAAYWSTDMRYKPWTYEELYKPTEWQSKYNPGQECAVCRFVDGTPYENYAGCTVIGTCYHGDGGNMGRSKDPNCANYEAVYDCPGHEHTDSDGDSYTEYCSGPLGCDGYWECQGHDHWGCPDGHHTPVCYGHVDLTMSVNIASLNRIYDMGGVEIKGEKDLPQESTTAPESTEAPEDENQEGGEE